MAKDLAGLKKSWRSELLDQIEVQLKFEPARATRNRKILSGLEPPWEHVDPKPPHTTTEEIL